MNKNLTIGVFDSGLGGLTVVREIKRKLPNNKIIYLGDTARVPYGTRSPETIRKFAEEDTEFLIDQNVDLIVVACNTVSSLALDVVKKHSSVPVFGVIEPATQKALKVTKNNKIGLVGTRATVNSNAYSVVSNKQQASMLVPLIEEGFVKGKEIELFIKKYFSNFIGSVDTLILGCTHYPIIKPLVKKYLGRSIKLIDPAEEIAEVVTNFISERKISKKIRSDENDIFYLTDVNDRFLQTAKMFLGYDIYDMVIKVEL